MKRYLLLLAIALFPSLLFAQAGNPDSTFGTLGRKVFPISANFNAISRDKGSCFYKQDATRLLYAYSQISVAQGNPMAVMRTDADGKPDSTFGVNGTAVIQFGSLQDAEPTFLTVINSKIFVCGKAGPDMGIACLTANGTLDTAWSHDGKLTLDFGGTDEFPVGMVIYNSTPRTYYVAGTSDSTFAVAKFKLNGDLDLGFSTDGKHTVDVGKGRMIGYEQGSGNTWGHMFGYSKTGGDTAKFRFTLVRINLSNSAATTLRARLTTGHNIVRAVTYNGADAYLAGECHDAAGGNTRVGILALNYNAVAIQGRYATAGRVLWGLPGQDVVPYGANVRTVTSIPSLFVGGHARQGANETSFLLKLDKNGYGDVLFAGKAYTMIPFGQAREYINEIEFMGTRLSERIVAIGPGPNSLLWSKTKNNTYLRVTPGWFPVQCPVRSNWNKIVDGGNHTTIILGDSGKFYNWYQGEDFVGSMPPIITWHRTYTGAGLTKLRGYKSSASPTDFWLVGDTGFAAKSGADGVNNTWGRARYHTRQNLNGVGSSGSGVGYIVGDSGLLVYNYDWNSINTKLPTGTRQKLNYIQNQSYIVGDSGVILKYVSAASWARKNSPTTENLNWVSSSQSSAVVAVGQNGTILRSTDGNTWVKIVTPFTEDLNSVDNTGGTFIIVGEGGLILKSTDNGLTWRQQISPTAENLRSIIVESATQASAVGDNGTVIMTMSGGTFVANQPALGQSAMEWNLYPNPAGKAITVQFSVARPGRVMVDLLDLMGKHLEVLINEDMQAGNFGTQIPLTTPPGCYMVRLETDGKVDIKKLIIE